MKIAHFGTFDVSNFGDLLFPLIARHRLLTLPDARLVCVSPIGGPSVLPDAPSSIGFEEFARRRDEFDGTLIGGGNIVRVLPTALVEYQTGFTPVTAYPDIWLGAAALSVAGGASICWNAPGVPEDFGEALRPLLAASLKLAHYISVRDETSKARLLATGADVSVHVVPDTAWEVDSLWGADQLKSAFERAFTSRGIETPGKAIAFHANERYLFGLSAQQLAAVLDETCRRFQATAILLAMGRCHGDHELAIQVGGQMSSSPLIIDQPASLCEMVACIAHSAAYVGSSMHGFITASAFGVPAICIANRSVTKFEGMINTARLQNTICDNWSEACDRLLSMGLDNHRDHLRQARIAIQERLDEHWGEILARLVAARKVTQTPNTAAATPIPMDQLSTYRANVLAPVALEQMHAAQRQRARVAAKSEGTLNVPIDIGGYDFLDFGCSKGGSMDFARRAFGGQRGLGIDMDPVKVTRSIDIGNEAKVADITRTKFVGRVRFVIMSHFLEHLDSIEQARRCIDVSIACARQFVLIQQPYFDADGYLFERGLKLAWSDWHGHRSHVTSTQFHAIASRLLTRQKIARFVLGRRMRIIDSNDPWIHPLQSAPDQHLWSATSHPPKAFVPFDFPVFRELFVLIFPTDETAFDRNLETYVRKKDCEVLFDSRR